METVWQNHYTRFWRVTNEPEYCGTAWVERVERIYTAGEDQQFILTIGGYLPFNEWIMHLRKNEQFEIMLGVCADPSVYRVQDAIMRFTNCAPIKSWMEKPIALSRSDVGCLAAYAEIKCHLDTLFSEREAQFETGKMD